MDKNYTGPVERERTLLERIQGLEAHHEETRKRLASLEERFQHQRDRLDTVLGSESYAAESESDVVDNYVPPRRVRA